MIQRRKAEKHVCENFIWKLFQRNGVYYADGRTNKQDLGKHSLGTKHKEEALETLYLLDRRMAIDSGLLEPNSYEQREPVTLSVGWELHMDFLARPLVLGGASEQTRKRYRPVGEKFMQFGEGNRITTWDQVDKNVLEKYGRWLKAEGYADRTLYLELNHLKSIINWLIEENRLPAECAIKLKLNRPTGTDTYCYSREEVRAMLEHCQSREDLQWLAHVILALSCTGMRISELASLRWSDLDKLMTYIHLTDERSRGHRTDGTVRTTKGKRSRRIPIHPELAKCLSQIRRQKDGRIFHGPRGGKLKPDTVRNIFIREVLTPLKVRFPKPPEGLGFEDGRLHSFRHYFVSQAFLCGATEGEIMEWVGHQDSKMVAHYRHLRDEDSQRKMSSIDFLGIDGATKD